MIRYFIGIIIALFAILIIACSPRVAPSKVEPEVKKAYDTADYNIIFNDALRQKMLGNQADAARLFERALKVNSNSDASYYQLSLIYQGVGDMASALKNASMAASLDPMNSWYIQNAGVQYYMIGQADSAIYYFEKLIELEPDREDHKMTLVGIYEGSREYEKAEGLIMMFIDKYGEEERLLVSLVRIYSLSGRNKEAEATIIKLINSDANKVNSYGMLAEFYKEENRVDEAIAVYEKLFEIAPNNTQLQLSYLDFLRVTLRYDDFISDINGIILSDSITLEGKTGILASILTDEQLLSEKASELAFPLMVFTSNYRNSPDVILLVAQIFEACNNDERALVTMRDYCERNPDDYLMWERLLFAYSSKGKTDDLYRSAKYVATKFNLYPVPKLLLAFAASEKKEYDLALGELDKALMLAGDQEELLIEITSLLANVYYEKGEKDKAFQTYAKGIELSPNNALLLNNYAYYLSEEGLRLKEALDMIERCLVIESNSTYLDTKAWILYKLEKYRKADDVMNGLYLENAMESADHYEHYGFIRKALKDCEMAVDLWREAKRIDSSKVHLDKEIIECQSGT
jgi:tetratricopeptide (TPR) repeat protein